MKTAMITELFPGKFPGHKLNSENTLSGYGPWRDQIIERGKYFNKLAYTMKPGWADPPYSGGSSTAVVFEKTGPADAEGAYHESKEPGVYWMHCPATYKMILDDSLPKPKVKRKTIKRKKKNVTRSRSNKL